MKKIVFAGCPNAGKTTLFNLVTGKSAKTGNWHGVTVQAETGILKQGEKQAELIDLPGLYSLNSYSMEEKAAQEYLLAKDYDVVFLVADADNLGRSLSLLGQLKKSGIPAALLVNFYGGFVKNGGKLDGQKMSQILKTPVFLVKNLKKTTKNALKSFIFEVLKKDKFDFGELDYAAVELAYTRGREKSYAADRIFLNNFLALPAFLLILAGVFYITFAGGMPGDFLKGKLEYLISDVLKVKAGEFLQGLVPAYMQGLVCDGIIGGAGILLSFIPQIFILFIALTVMEESGYISRLAFMTDGIFKKAGLSGRAVFSLLMGFGCTAAAMLTTRGYENKNLQRRTLFILPYISCSAKLPVYSMIATAFFTDKFLVIITVYAIGVLIALFSARILNKFDKQTEEFILELPAYRRVRLSKLAKSLLFYLRQFIIKIGGVVLAFVLLMWFLMSFSPSFVYLGASSSGSILAKISGFLKYMFYPIGIRSWEVSVAMLSGLIAKETVAGTLSVFYPDGLEGIFTPASALALLVFVMTYTTCISAVAASAKEIGIKKAVLLALFQLVSALLFSYLMYFLCMLTARFGAVKIICALAALNIAYFCITRLKRHRCKNCGGCNAQKIYCNGKNIAKQPDRQ